MRGCISALLPDLGTHFLLLGCLSLNMRVLYLSLLYLSLGNMFFSEVEWRGSGSGGSGAGRQGGLEGGETGRDVLYERRIGFQQN